MIAPRLHAREDERLAALEQLRILDTDAEERFDRLVALTASILDVPISLVSLVDSDRQWFKARTGLDATETPRDISFCGHAVADDVAQLVVEDAAHDDRFRDNPLVVEAPHIRFYAGQVVRDPSGLPVGTLCAIDRRPRTMDAAQRAALEHLGWLVEQELARADEIDLARKVVAGEAAKSLIVDTMTEGVVLQSGTGSIIEWNRAAERVLGLSADELAGRTSTDPRWRAIRADGSPWPGDSHPAMEALRTGQPVVDALMGVHHPDGKLAWLRVNSQPVMDDNGAPLHVLTVFADVTAEQQEVQRRRELEDALAISEEASRVSLDSLEQGVILADGSGQVHRMNPAAREILGYEADDLNRMWNSSEWQTYDEAGRVLPPEERPIGTALATGEIVRDRVVGWVRADQRRLLLRVSCIPDVAGTGRLLIAFSDITEERRVQRILDATFEAAPAGLALIDAGGSIVRCNDRFADQADRPRDALIGVEVMSLVHPEDRGVADESAAQLSAGKGGELEHRVARPSGGELWVKTHLGVIDDPDEPLAIAVSFDVTTERRLLAELARYGHLFRRANDVIVIIDPDGSVRFASSSSHAILGDPGTDVRRTIFDRLHRDDVAHAKREIATLVAGEREVGPFTVRARTIDGELRHLECVALNLLDEPDVDGIVVTARDTTDRERLTQELAHQSLHDVLTGLGNRRMFQDRLQSALDGARTGPGHVCLCFIDLDDFKLVNDIQGHAAGDALLAGVAEAIRSSIRSCDVAARMGGDEFVVVFDDVVDEPQAREIVERVRTAVLGVRHDAGTASASFGLAVSCVDDTPSDLLRRADAALYRAKAFHDSRLDADELVGAFV